MYPILMPWAGAARRSYTAVGRYVASRLVARDPANLPIAEAVPAVNE